MEEPKKIKVTWSVFNLMQETQAEVVKLQGYAKAFFGMSAVATLAGSNEKYALCVALLAFVVDTALAGVRVEKL